MLVSHLHDNNGNLTATIIAVKREDGKSFAISWAKCLPDKVTVHKEKNRTITIVEKRGDQFSRKRGIAIAKSRLEDVAFPKGKVPDIILKFVPQFAHRCRRYFKVNHFVVVGVGDGLLRRLLDAADEFGGIERVSEVKWTK